MDSVYSTISSSLIDLNRIFHVCPTRFEITNLETDSRLVDHIESHRLSLSLLDRYSWTPVERGAARIRALATFVTWATCPASRSIS